MNRKKLRKKFRKKVERDDFLLKKLAEALTVCEKAKLKPRLQYDMVLTTRGYVLPPLKKGGQWDARPALSSPYEDVVEEIDLYYTLSIMVYMLIPWTLSSMATPVTAITNVAVKPAGLRTTFLKSNDALPAPRSNPSPSRRDSGRRFTSTAPSPSVILSWDRAGNGQPPRRSKATAWSASPKVAGKPV